MLHIRCVCMTTIVLTPGELAVQESNVDRWHFFRFVIVGYTEVARAEQFIHGACGNRGHVTAMVIQPVCIARFWNAVADERKTWRTQRDKMMRINRQLARIHFAVLARGGTILHVVARHPVVFTASRKVFHTFTKHTTMKCSASLSGRTDQTECKAFVEGQCYKRGFSVSGNAFNTHLLSVDGRIRLQIVQSP